MRGVETRLAWSEKLMNGTIARTMGKKKPTSKGQEDKPVKPAKAAKEVLYVEMDAALKRRLVRLAELPHRNRKITAEAIMAIRRYVEEEEKKENLPPIGEGESKE
jgi:predicted transcriptional regulator